MNAKSLPEASQTSLPASAEEAVHLQRTRERLRRFATLLDSGIGIPGTRWQIGIEALIGLIPGIGDLAGAALGSWFVVEAMRLKAPGHLLARMIGNVVFDTVLGIVPVIGDIADFVFKSNRRNLQLLDAHLDARLGVTPARTHRRAAWGLALVALAVIAWLLWRFVIGH